MRNTNVPRTIKIDMERLPLGQIGISIIRYVMLSSLTKTIKCHGQQTLLLTFRQFNTNYVLLSLCKSRLLLIRSFTRIDVILSSRSLLFIFANRRHLQLGTFNCFSLQTENFIIQHHVSNFFQLS